MTIFQIDIPGLIGEVDQEDLAFLSLTKAKIIENLGNPLFGTKELAVFSSLSSSQLTRRFRQVTTYSPAKMIRHFRMEYAMVLVKETQLPMKEITLRTGFMEQANFCRTFKRHFEANPSDIRLQKKQPSNSFDFQCSSPMTSKDMQYILWLAGRQHWLQEVLSHITEHMDDEHFGAEQLALQMAMSTSQLNRKLHQLLKLSASRLIRNIRLALAAELLTQGTESISAIAHKAGFFDHPHFCRSFKAAFKKSPRAFRKDKNSNNSTPFISELLKVYKTDK